MADFPTSPCPTIESRISGDRGVRLERAEDGTVRGRSLYAEPVYDLELHYKTAADERDTLVDFVDANLTAANSLVLAGYTYTLYFADDPISETPLGGNVWQIVLRAVGTRAPAV